MSELVVDGNKIKKLMIDFDLTGRELARRVDVHEMTISGTLNGGSWSHQVIGKIAAELSVNPLELLTVKETEAA